MAWAASLTERSTIERLIQQQKIKAQGIYEIQLFERENNNDLDKDRKKEHMVEKTIDARGLTCPKPVILTKKEMEQSQPQDVILVDVDNEMAVENLRKLTIPRKQNTHL